MSERFSGPWIKALRERLGMSQEQLGAKLCTSASTIARWEQGNRSPNQYNRLQLLAFERRIDGTNDRPYPSGVEAAADLANYIREQYADADQTGRDAMDAVAHAERAGLSPLALHLAGSAAIEHAYGTTAAEWITQRLDNGSVDKERLERVISELIGAGLWPWG